MTVKTLRDYMKKLSFTVYKVLTKTQPVNCFMYEIFSDEV